jgi:hypothetical protein
MGNSARHGSSKPEDPRFHLQVLGSFGTLSLQKGD